MMLLAILCLVAQVCSFVYGQSEPNCKCKQCQGKLELGIVLDSSSSIWPENFTSAKDFLKEYLREFTIGKDAVRVSLITYGRHPNAQDAFYLDTYNNYDDLSRAIGNLQFRGSDYTGTGEAIQFLRDRQLARQFVRDELRRVGVVITDGNSQNRNLTIAEADKTRDAGIELYAVGVGLGINDDELKNIAGDSSRVYRVNSYEGLKTITKTLANSTCTGSNNE